MKKMKTKNNIWFDDEPVEEFCRQQKKDFVLLTVSSPRGVGKSTWMRNRFLKTLEAGLISGYIVRHRDDFAKIVSNFSQIKINGNPIILEYSQKKFELYWIKKKHDEKGKEIKERKLVAFICPLSLEHKLRSFEFQTAEYWFYDDIGSSDGGYLNKESIKFYNFLSTATRWGFSKIYCFLNKDDKYCFIYDYYPKKLLRKSGQFHYLENDGKLVIWWDYKTTQAFKDKVVKGNVISVLSYAHPENANASISGENISQFWDKFIDAGINAKHLYSFTINKISFHIKKRKKHFIICSGLSEKKKKIYDLYLTEHWIYDNIKMWSKDGLLRFDNLDTLIRIKQNIRKDVL